MYHEKKHLFQFCLQYFNSSKLLENHVENYLATNHTKRITRYKNAYARFLKTF